MWEGVLAMRRWGWKVRQDCPSITLAPRGSRLAMHGCMSSTVSFSARSSRADVAMACQARAVR